MARQRVYSNKSGQRTSGPSSKTSIQCKLAVGPVNDPAEKEAEVMANKIVGMPSIPSVMNSSSTGIQRKCKDCEDEMIRQKPSSPYMQNIGSSGLPVSDTIQNKIHSSKGSGRSLDAMTQSYMENRFESDFSQVRIHADNNAFQLNRKLNSKAFTVGNDIYFNEGEYQPHAITGKHLLAHELTHTIQQGGVIRRQPKDAFGRQLGFVPTPQQEEFDRESVRIGWDRKGAELEMEIWADPVYQKLKQDSQDRVRKIVDTVRAKPLGEAQGERYYYLKKLKTALSTPFKGTESGDAEYGCSPGAEEKNRKVVDEALNIEKDWGGYLANLEEDIVAGATKKVARAGQGGKIYYVDRTDLTNIRVLIQVKLNGVPAEVGKIKQLEDAIEREVMLTTKGYVLDIRFVNHTGFDVFEFTVSFCQWPNSGNWASSPVTLSHEVHHALGLPDRYDYIERHMTNDMMNVPMRLVWFEEELAKTEPNNMNSKMGMSYNPLLNDDVCKVAFPAGAEREKCIVERTKFNPAGSPPFIY